MPLGLDLRGGLYLLYQVDVSGAISQVLDSYEQEHAPHARRRRKCRSSTSRTSRWSSERPNAVRVTLPPNADADAVRAAAREDAHRPHAHHHRRLPAAPPCRACSRAQQIRERQDYAIQKNIETLRNRVNELGVSGAHRAAAGSGPHQRAAAGRAELGRGEGHPRQGRDPRIPPRGHAEQRARGRRSAAARRSAPSSTPCAARTSPSC